MLANFLGTGGSPWPMKTAWVVSWLPAPTALAVMTLVAAGVITWGIPSTGAGDVMVEMWPSSGAGGRHPSTIDTEGKGSERY